MNKSDLINSVLRRCLRQITFSFHRWGKIAWVAAVVLTLVVGVNRIAASLIDERLNAEFDLNELAYDADSVSTQLFSLSPRVALENMSLGWPESEAFFYQVNLDIQFDWLSLLRGVVHITSFDLTSATLSLDQGKQEDTRLFSWLQRMGQQERADLPWSLATLVLGDVNIELFDELAEQHLMVRANGSMVPEASGSRLSLQLDGEWNLLPVRALVGVTSSQPLVSEVPANDNALHFRLDSRISDLDGLVNGELLWGEQTQLTQLSVDIEGHGLSNALAQSIRFESPIEVMRLLSHWRTETPSGGSGFLELQVDRSDVSAQVRAQPIAGVTGDQHWVIETQSKRIDSGNINALQDLFALFESGSDETSHPTAEVTPSLTSRFFDQSSIDLTAVFQTVLTGSVQIKDIHVTAQQTADQLQLNAHVMNVGSGRLTAELNALRHGDAWVGDAAIDVDDAEIREVFAHGQGFDLVAGRVSGRSRLSFVGQTLAEMLSNLNGENIYVVEAGEIDSLLVEVAGLDFMESIGLVANQQVQTVDIDCGLIDAPIERGRIQINRFLLDTPDTVFTLSGHVDLPANRMNLSFAPNPRDASYFTATTSVRLVGPLARPKIRPGKELIARVTLAAALAAFATPVAVLLPFMDIGDAESVSKCLTESVN